MAMQKATIGILVLVAVMGVFVSAFGSLVATQKITSSGSITAIGVAIYQDSACTTVLSTISWGTLNSGATMNYTIYVKNTGNIPVTLTMMPSNWNPTTASDYITLTWNQQTTVLSPNSVVQAVLTLSVSSSISSITNFSCDITITGTQ